MPSRINARFLAPLLSLWWALSGEAKAALTPAEFAAMQGPRPAWVRDLPQPPPAPAGTHTNVTFLFQDFQVHVPEATEYRHTLYRIEAVSALSEFAQVHLEYEPELETIVFHQLTVHRGDRQWDGLNKDDIRIYDDEANARNRIYTGGKKIDVNLRNVQVGDSIEFSYSRRKKPGLFQKVFSERFMTQYSIPLQNFRLLVLTNQDQPLLANDIAGLEKQERSVGSLRETSWIIRNAPILEYEDRAPYASLPLLRVSTLGSWSQMIDLILPHYQAEASLPEELRAEVDAWRPLPRLEQLKKAASYVQKKIRYLSLSIGARGWIPQKPALTLKNGYGDCKDKALLLHTLLHALGIPSAVALVNASDPLRADQILPGSNNFDHAIVQAELDGVTYWIDGTVELDEGRFVDYPPIYGDALVVKAGQKTLTPMQPRPQSLPTMAIDEDFEWLKSGYWLLRRTVVARGEDARRIHYQLMEQGEKALQSNELNSLTSEYGNVQAVKPRAIKIQDDGSIQLEGQYHIKPDGTKDKDTVSLYTVRYNFDLPNTLADRKLPLVQNYPRNITQRVRIHGRNVVTSRFKQAVSGSSYEADLSWENDTPTSLIGVHNFRTTGPEIPARELAKLRADRDLLLANESMLFNQRSASPLRKVPGLPLIFLGIVIIGLPVFSRVRSWFRSAPGRRFQRKVQGHDGDTPHQPILYKQDAEMIQRIGTQPCPECGRKSLEAQPKQSIVLNEAVIDCFDCRCAACGKDDRFYGRLVSL